MSVSQKYYIVGTKSRVIKLGTTDVDKKISGIEDIVLFQEHFVYVFTSYDVIVLDFRTFTVVK
jgi:hypothetical protein